MTRHDNYFQRINSLSPLSVCMEYGTIIGQNINGVQRNYWSSDCRRLGGLLMTNIHILPSQQGREDNFTEEGTSHEIE